MIRKAVLGVGILLIGGWLCARTSLWSYVVTGWKETKGFVNQQVPIDFEIKRAKDMLGNLDKVDDKLISVMANEMVAAKHLDKDIRDTEIALETQREELRARNEQLKTFTVAKDSNNSREQFALDVERRFKRLKTVESTLKTKRELLNQHNERLTAAKDQRDGLKVQKSELQARIESLETQVALLKAAEARSKIRVDDGQLTELAHVKALVDDLEKRIDTSMTELQLREEIKASAPVAPLKEVNLGLTQDIDSYLNGGRVATDK